MPYVYFLTNASRTVLYIGVTVNLPRRLTQHRMHHSPTSFTSRYQCYTCVYVEEYERITEAIAREKYLKSLSRQSKENLINTTNPAWQELMPYTRT